MSSGPELERLELSPKADPARDFIEALVAKFAKRIDVLGAKVADLQQQFWPPAKKTLECRSLRPSSTLAKTAWPHVMSK